ncbi:MAG TPA: hypothetical protein VD735_05860, partial [Candidatus Saccharimonadales bacterium]|nr:hypothetical protein [Candidatus Saccharimonadales bacterium]
MHGDEFFQLAGVASVLTTWLAIGYILLRQPRDPAQSISHHAAKNDADYKTFAVLMTVGVLAMLCYMVQWLAPTLDLPPLFIVVASTAVVLELIATWVPLRAGRAYAIHQF